MKVKGAIPISSEILNLTAQIVISHASMTELTPKELVAEIKTIHDVLVSLETEVAAPELKPIVTRQRKPRKGKMKESPEAKAIENEEGLPVGDPDYMEFMESREG
jgi:predicted transcriptional regulator